MFLCCPVCWINLLVWYAGLRVVSMSRPCSVLGLFNAGVALSGCNAVFNEVRYFGVSFWTGGSLQHWCCHGHVRLFQCWDLRVLVGLFMFISH